MKIIILDLDDTIYDFKTFYYQAFINISLFLSSKSNVKQQIILKNMLSLYKKNSLNVIDLHPALYNLKKFLFSYKFFNYYTY